MTWSKVYVVAGVDVSLARRGACFHASGEFDPLGGGLSFNRNLFTSEQRWPCRRRAEELKQAAAAPTYRLTP